MKPSFLEIDFEAAASGIFDRLLGVVVEIVVHQAASTGIEGMSSGAGTKANTFRVWVAHFSEMMGEPLIPSHSLRMPSAV